MPLDFESPKQRFQKSKPLVEAHRQLISNPQFQLSIDAALLQFQHESQIAVGSDIGSAAAQQFMMMGAHKFADTLKNISEIAEKKTIPSIPQLHPV